MYRDALSPGRYPDISSPRSRLAVPSVSLSPSADPTREDLETLAGTDADDCWSVAVDQRRDRDTSRSRSDADARG